MVRVPFAEATSLAIIARQASLTSTSSKTPTSSTTATSTTASSSSDGGIFDFTSSSSSPSSSPTQTSSTPGRTVPQLVLEWVIAFVAVIVLVSLIFCRFAQLRRRGRSARQIFSRGSQRPPSPGARPFHHSIRHPYGRPSPNNLPNVLLPSQPLHSAIHSDALFTIPTLPPSGRGHRAVRGADTDAQGRREGPVDPEQHGEGIEKEILPAYDPSSKGPPRYAEVMRNYPGRVPPGFDEEMEMANLGIPDRHPADRPLSDPFGDEPSAASPSGGSRNPLPNSDHSPEPDPNRPHLTMPEPHSTETS